MSSFTISMRTSGKRLAGNNYRKYCANEETSKAASSSMNQNGFLVSSNKRLHLKPGYRMKRACESKNILNGKPIETLHKKSNYSLGRYESSFKLKEKGTCLTQREDSKNLSGRAEKKLGKRRRWKIKKKTVEQDGVSLMKRRTRYLLIKLKLEQNLIDAYSADGWKGQSREKIKPEKELQRAQRQILKCKLGIRDSIHQLDLIGSEGRIEDSVMLPDGSVFHEHIFCAKCKSREAFPDNDIILCDGNCNCGFHQKCLEPPLEKIPPGDQGWLCNICDCKVEILETINAHLGTCFTVNSCWEDIFKEAIASPDTERRCPNTAEDWPSDDSEDEDYCPDNTINKTEFEENVSDDTCSSNDLICLSDASLNSTYLSSGEFSDHQITNNRRQRRDVDYQKLYDEMFGKEPNEVEEESEDEDWGPYSRRQRRIESNAGITTTDAEDKVVHEKMASQKRSSCNRRSFFRIPPDAIEKLRQAFAENELPSRTVKENLSKQLGISAAKVDKWFKNARYASLKLRKADVSNISAVNERHRHTSEEAVSLDNTSLLPLASIFNLLRLKKKSRQRENLVSLKRATITVSSGEILVGPRLENAARFEKYANATNTELSSMKTTDYVSQSEQFFINEIKRLWILEWRLHCLKQQLSACKDGNRAPIESHSGGGVIYVPVAEVKEKASGCKIMTS